MSFGWERRGKTGFVTQIAGFYCVFCGMGCWVCRNMVEIETGLWYCRGVLFMIFLEKVLRRAVAGAIS